MRTVYRNYVILEYSPIVLGILARVSVSAVNGLYTLYTSYWLQVVSWLRKVNGMCSNSLPEIIYDSAKEIIRQELT